MPVFLLTQGFEKYNPFPQPPPVASQIGCRSLEEARFPTNFRRAFPSKPSSSGVNHHHHRVDLVVLYTVEYPFYRIHHCLTVSHLLFHSPARISMNCTVLFPAGRQFPLWPANSPPVGPAPSSAGRPLPCWRHPSLRNTAAREVLQQDDLNKAEEGLFHK